MSPAADKALGAWHAVNETEGAAGYCAAMEALEAALAGLSDAEMEWLAGQIGAQLIAESMAAAVVVGEA